MDLQRIRADFPALASGTAFFDSPGGTQTPTPVIDAIADALRNPLSNRGTRTEAERNAEQHVIDARAAIADLLNADPGGIIFGRSATALTFDMARTLSKTWASGDEVVVTRLDHDANIRPWVIMAERAGATVLMVEFDRATGELPAEAIGAVVSDRTRLVAVAAASNLIGTMPDIPAIADLVHAAGALLYVDGVHYTAHALVDLENLGADFFTCSPYKFFGPHHGVLAASPGLLETLEPDKLLPSTNQVPERFELGTLPYEMLAGSTAAVNYLAGIGEADGTRRQRLVESHRQLSDHETELRQHLEDGLNDLGATIYSRAKERTSTLLFSLPGKESEAIADRLASAGVNAPAGSFYALEASRHLGLGEAGAVRVGIAPYNSINDVDRLLASLRQLLAGQLGE